MTLTTEPKEKIMSTSIQPKNSNASVREAYEAYAIYADAFKNKIRDKETQIKGLRALVRYIDAMVALGQGGRCSVTLAWDGGEPSRVADAAQRRAKAVKDIARLEECTRIP